MTTTANVVDQPTITITEEIHVRASIETTFESLLVQLGEFNETPDGQSLAMKIEAWPGGRWYRDLGGNNGHLWGFVQSIKRPALLEMWGPMFLSTGATSNVMYRLKEEAGGTLITFKHTILGPVPDEFRDKAPVGWAFIHQSAKSRAEASAKK